MCTQVYISLLTNLVHYDNEQTTLKRLKYKDDAIYLCPENDSMQPIVIRGEDRAKLRIQGVATGIIKKIE